MNFLAISAYEWNVALAGRSIAEAIRILDRLDSLDGYTSPSSRERVQGGENVEQAALRAELLDRLQWKFSPMEKALAEAFREATGHRERYALGLIDGLSGEELRKRARLPKAQFHGCRQWLYSLMSSALK
ncbi:MAG: hypothetical protein EOM65_12910 [Synergistales bacterium]|nr:hypothetical protein [Synergistales bacterium]